MSANRIQPILLLLLVLSVSHVFAQEQDDPRIANRCELVPQADHQVSFQIDGVEKLRWHYGDQYPRPFFFPFNGPSGASLTRMGHPGAPNHDHHQSIWFAHNKVNGLDFWGNGKGTLVRQKMWYAYEDGDSEAIMASVSGWVDADGNEVMEQEIVAAIIPMQNNEHTLEIQFTLRPPPGGSDSRRSVGRSIASSETAVELEKTNFGFLAVRVAKTLSAHFGGGTLTNSEGLVDEKNIFGKSARWMDYSGPARVGERDERITLIEGITFFDHPTNPRYPTGWHVRKDGWMGAAFCMFEGMRITQKNPLTLRYLLHAHSGAYDHDKAQSVHDQFTARPGFEVIKDQRGHRHYQVRRNAES